jgi:transposase
LPELGACSRQKIAALVGVAPLNRDSGQFWGRRIIWGGRRNVRRCLDMATLVAVRRNVVIQAHYEKLLAPANEKKSHSSPACESCLPSSLRCSVAVPLGNMRFNSPSPIPGLTAGGSASSASAH